MGNYVYQVFATTLCGETCRFRRAWEPESGAEHGVGTTEQIFAKHFMVAANVPDYLGIFTAEYNPGELPHKTTFDVRNCMCRYSSE